jgi:SAM-dependent methyltransferase
MIDLPDNTLDEVFAVAFIEHLTFDQAVDTFRNVHRRLRPGGVFLFDVPDYPRWAAMYLRCLNGVTSEATLEHCRRTLFGWGRWPGDSHLYGWDGPHLGNTLADVGFTIGKDIFDGLPLMKARTYRRRFDELWDAHLYVCAVK